VLTHYRVAIVGPTETPYENGLFEFDLWCPQNYPFESPKVLFKGTGGGRVRLNPNLYADGKGKSHSLIQSVLLCTDLTQYASLFLEPGIMARHGGLQNPPFSRSSCPFRL
jgi:hypothetical protein